MAGGGIAVDLFGDAYVTGSTNSSLFPVTTDAFQSTYLKPVCQTDCSDAFLIKLNPAGSAPVYSSYLGGTDGNDVATAVAIDSTGDACRHSTSSAAFPCYSRGISEHFHGTGGGSGGSRDALGSQSSRSAGPFACSRFFRHPAGTRVTSRRQSSGSGFQSGASVKLSGGGQQDIVASSVIVGPDALYLTATFNLQGAVTGPRDVVVINADRTVITLPQAFHHSRRWRSKYSDSEDWLVSSSWPRR